MTDVYLTDSRDMHGKTAELLKTRYGYDGGIEFTEGQKPFCTEGVYEFNITHSGARGAIAVSKQPVGIDLELYKGKTHLSVSSRFSPRERGEIKDERDFLIHWTAREAFIKMKGARLYEYFKSIEYFGGQIYLDGLTQDCKIFFRELEYGILTVCGGDGHYTFYKF